MFSQNNIYGDTITTATLLKVPLGNNLNTNDPSLQAKDGAIAIDLTSKDLYYVSDNIWKSTSQNFSFSVGPVGNAPNANAATFSNTVLNLQPASQSFPGIVTTDAQTFSGVKTFVDGISSPGMNYTVVSPINPINQNAIIIDNINSDITLEYASVNFPGIVSTDTQTFAGTKTFSNGIVSTGTNYVATVPINPVDDKGIIIDNVNNDLTLEYASSLFPGIVSIGAQTFAGTKTFSNGIVSTGTNYIAAVPVNSTDNKGIIVDNVNNDLTLEYASSLFPGIVSTDTQTFSGTKTFSNGIVSTGTNYTVVSPINPVDDKGIIIDNVNNDLTLEYASSLFPGIVSTGAQIFAGTKTFSNGIVSTGTNYIAATPVNPVDDKGIIVDNVNNDLTLEYASSLFPGIVSTGIQTFSGVKNFPDGITYPGMSAPNNYVAMAPIDAIDNSGIIIDNVNNDITLENASATFPGIVSTGAQSIAGLKTFNDGIQVTGIAITGMSRIFTNYYQSGVINVSYGGISLFNPGVSSTITCERIGGIIFINLTYFIATVTGGGSDIISLAAGSIPVPFRPTSTKGCGCAVISGNNNFTFPQTGTQGWALVKSDGGLDIGCAVPFGTPNFTGIDANQALNPFSGPGQCGIFNQTLTIPF